MAPRGRLNLRNKGGLCEGVATLAPSCPDCLESLGASTSWSPKGLSRPVIELLYLLWNRKLQQTYWICNILPLVCSLSDQFTPFHPLFPRCILVLSIPLCLCLACCLFPLALSTHLCMHFILPMHAICPAYFHLIWSPYQYLAEWNLWSFSLLFSRLLLLHPCKDQPFLQHHILEIPQSVFLCSHERTSFR